MNQQELAKKDSDSSSVGEGKKKVSNGSIELKERAFHLREIVMSLPLAKKSRRVL